MKFSVLFIVLVFLCVSPGLARQNDNVIATREEPDSPGQVFQSFGYDDVIDGDTFLTQGAQINIWGIAAPTDPTYAPVAKMFFETMLSRGQISCKLISVQTQDYYCLIDGRDIGSMIVQMGMAKASNDYYVYEQEIAQEKGYGSWKK